MTGVGWGGSWQQMRTRAGRGRQDNPLGLAYIGGGCSRERGEEKEKEQSCRKDIGPRSRATWSSACRPATVTLTKKPCKWEAMSTRVAEHLSKHFPVLVRPNTRDVYHE